MSLFLFAEKIKNTKGTDAGHYKNQNPNGRRGANVAFAAAKFQVHQDVVGHDYLTLLSECRITQKRFDVPLALQLRPREVVVEDILERLRESRTTHLHAELAYAQHRHVD